MEYIKFYNGSVNAGAKDGTLINVGNPVFAVVNTDGTEVSQNIAVRCEDGYSVYGNATLSFAGGDNKKYWAFEVNGVKSGWGEDATISGLTDTNTIVKIYTKAGSNENPSNDTSVEITIACEIQAKA